MTNGSLVAFGRFEWRPAQRQLLADGAPTSLKGRALDVLQVLVTHRDRVVTKSELLDLVWRDTFVEEANLHVQVSALRKVLGPARSRRFPAAATASRRPWRRGPAQQWRLSCVWACRLQPAAYCRNSRCRSAATTRRAST
jgi:hypothetical protein